MRWKYDGQQRPPFAEIPGSDDDLRLELLRQNRARPYCEWKGAAIYFDLVAGGPVMPSVAWSYPQPCGFYGGWVTSNLVGPIKGASGTEGW